MKLVHITQEPRDKFIQVSNNQMSESAFIRDPQQDQSDLRKKFDTYSSAKLLFSDSIAQNLCLRLNQGPNFQDLHETNYNYENNGFGGGKESCEYRLQLATSGNFVYFIYFDKVYLKKDESVFVVKSDEQFVTPAIRLQQHLNTQTKCFEFVFDAIKNREMFVFGTQSFVPHEDNNRQRTRQQAVEDCCTKSLIFLSGDKQVITLKDNTPQQSLFGRLATGLGLIRQPNVEKNQQVVYNSQLNSINNEGVVALKTLTNGLVAAVFSNGVLKVVRASDACVLSEFKLVDQSKILSAQIASKSQAVIPGEHGYNRTLLVGVSFVLDISQENQNYFQTLSLTFTNLNPADWTQISAKLINVVDMGNQVLCKDTGLVQLKQQITNLTYSDKSQSFWISVWCPENNQTQVRDMGGQSLIKCRQMQEDLYKIQDQIEQYDCQFSIDDVCKQEPKIYTMLQNHYTSRISVYCRFTNQSFPKVFEQRRHTWDSSQSVKQNVTRILRQLKVSEMQKLLQSLQLVQQENSRILCVSDQLTKIECQIVVRPLGISIVQNVCKAAKQSVAVNQMLLSQKFGGYDLASRFLALLKSQVQSGIREFDQMIQQRPKQLNKCAEKLIQHQRNKLNHDILESMDTDQVLQMLKIEIDMIKDKLNNQMECQLTMERWSEVFQLGLERTVVGDLQCLHDLVRDIKIALTYLTYDDSFVDQSLIKIAALTSLAESVPNLKVERFDQFVQADVYRKYYNHSADLAKYLYRIQDQTERLPLQLSKCQGDRRLFIRSIDQLTGKQLHKLLTEVQGEFYTYHVVLRISASEMHGDDVWEVLFNQAQNPDYLYLAVTNTQDIERRKKLLLRFLEFVVKSQMAQAVLFGRCMFSNTDVTLLTQALQQTLNERPNLCQMHNYHLIATIYNQRDQFASFAWQTYQRYQLQQQVSVLELCYQAIDNNEFNYKSIQLEKKRRNSEITNETVDDCDLVVHKVKGVTLVTRKKVLAALLLSRAKIQCQADTESQDPLMLSKILAQRNQFDLAIQLALSNNVSPAYALTTMMYQTKQEQEVARYLPDLTLPVIIEFCQNLVASDIEIPKSVQQRISESNYVQSLIRIYLGPEKQNVIKAIDFLVQNPESIGHLMRTDINTLVLLLQLQEQTNQVFEEQIGEIQQDLKSLECRPKAFQISSSYQDQGHQYLNDIVQAWDSDDQDDVKLYKDQLTSLQESVAKLSKAREFVVTKMKQIFNN